MIRLPTPLEVRRPPQRGNETKDERIRRMLVFEHDKIQARIEGLFSQLVDVDGLHCVHDDATAVEERVRRTIDEQWPRKAGERRSW